MVALTRRLASNCGLILGLIALAACATSPVTGELGPGADEERVERVAVVPLRLAARPGEPALGNDASRVVTSRVAAALMAAEIVDVVPPEDVALRLGLAGVEVTGARRAVGSELASSFGADAVLTGTVRRFQAREGGAMGALRPAGVWFDLELHTTAGLLIWSGSYVETQQAFSEDPASWSRARERGFEWVTAEALARYGARELVQNLVVETGWR